MVSRRNLSFFPGRALGRIIKGKAVEVVEKAFHFTKALFLKFVR